MPTICDLSRITKHSVFKNAKKSSLQIIYIKQDRIATQIFECSFLAHRPVQLINRSVTLLGLIQLIPTRLNRKLQNSLATLQCRTRWSIVSLSELHMLHQSGIIMPLFHKLSIVKRVFFPFTMTLVKNPT